MVGVCGDLDVWGPSMKMARRLWAGSVACSAMLLLGGCLSGTAALRPPPEPPPATDPGATEPDEATLTGQAYYRKIEDFYLSTDRLRTDRGGRDAPFGARDLARNVLAIAFHEEFSRQGGALVARQREVRLQRWAGPVRIGLDFGPSVPAAQQARDRAEVAGLAGRLGALTGLPVSLTKTDPNFRVLIVNPVEREASAPSVRAFLPQVSSAAVQSVVAMRPDVYCTVISNMPGKTQTYDRALAVIRGELPDLMRRACLHEEIAQGFGLINDSPQARPSVFNDNEEYALLTRQDELMLKILYDKRLRPGMTLAEARPIVETIAAELMPGES